MKIVHVSTYDIDGGAARAAFRIHESLVAAGHNSSMLVQVKHSGDERVEVIPRETNGTTDYFADLIQKYYITYNRTEISNTWFSLGWPGTAFFEHPLVTGADVVNLQWVAGLASPATLRALVRLGKPVVWTLHDQRPFTGGCHYTAGCSQYQTGCKACPQLAYDGWHLTAANLTDQVESMAALKPTIVSPSRWLADCARRSLVFQGARIEVIHNGINTTRFKAIDQAEARRCLLLPRNAFLLLCGVDNAGEKRKGLRELFAMMAGWHGELKAGAIEPGIGMLCFGEMNSLPELPIPVRRFGRVRTDAELSLIYSAADLFVHPSLEDNFPNTVSESMSCGTPVIAFSTGGATEMIVHEQTGLLVPCGETEKFGRVLLHCAQEPVTVRSLRINCRKTVEEHFSYAQQARGYGALYEELVRGKPSRVENDENNEHIAAEEPAPGFAKILPGLVRHAFDSRVDVAPPKLETASNGDDKGAQEKYAKRVKEILNVALKDEQPFRQLKAEVEAEIAELQGTASWATRATRGVKRRLAVL